MTPTEQDHALPPGFAERFSRWLGDEAPAFFAALAGRDVGLRLNLLRGPLEALRARMPWKTQPVPWCPEGLRLQEEAHVGSHPYHAAGVFYVQDPSAMTAGVLLDPRPGEWVLDVAAAPGGKATHLAARMAGQGVLAANEVVGRRAAALADNLERMGVTNALVTQEHPDRLAERWESLFDALLVDAPCSGEGMFFHNPQALRDWSLAAVEGNARRQQMLLDQAAPLVRPGGRLLYSTCTFSPEENEGVVAEFLAHHPDFALVDLPPLPGLSPGRPEWIGAPEEIGRSGRLWPHRGPGHGHFYALLRRKGRARQYVPPRRFDTGMPGRVLNLYRQGLRQVLVQPPPEEGLLLAGNDELYVTPMDPALWTGLHVLRPGWRVAYLRHGEVEADHALAVALRPEQAQRSVNLEVDDPRVVQYLRGSPWPDDGPAGRVLVTVDGFPLGWARRGGGRLTSRYPIHLRLK